MNKTIIRPNNYSNIHIHAYNLLGERAEAKYRKVIALFDVQ